MTCTEMNHVWPNQMPARLMAANDALGPAWCGLIILGIGLYAVKEIVAAHNGDVTVTSGAKEGIILTMRRPRTTPHRRNSNLSEQTADTPAGSIIG